VRPLAPYFILPALVAAVITAWGAWTSTDSSAEQPLQPNPLQLGAALQMAVLFQAVLMIVYLARQTWGESGVLTSAAVLGLTDVDALTLSMARGVAPTTSLELAALAIAVGVLSNTVLKCGLTIVFANARFRAIAGTSLALIAMAAAAGLFVLAA
jgi:uncharacterized membrane protein (DUF4010 family)